MWLKNKINFFSFSIIILLFSALEAQENNPNSLNKKLNYWQNKSGTEADTNLYSLFYKYGMYYQNENPDSAILMLNQSIIKAKSLNNKLKELESTRQVAWCYYVKEDYPKALSIYSNVIEQVDNLTLSDNEANSYLKLKAGCLGNSGIIFMLQSNYAKALDYYFNALELHEKVGYKKGQASTLGNIGLVYKEQANYEKAYYYYSKSLQIDVEIADKRGQAYNLGNIADFYERKGNYKLALKNYMQVLSISKSLGDKTGEAIALGNIGVVYKADENYPEALSYLENALKLNETLDNKSYQAINLNNIGDIYIKLKKFELANTYLNKAIEVDKFLEAQSGLKDDYFLLHELYLAKANPDEALKAYKQHILYRDSVESSENERASVQKEMQYEFNKKEVLTKAEQEKKDLRQRGIRNFIIVGLVMTLIFLVMVFRQRNNIKKEKERSEELLLNILPHKVAEELKQNGEAEAKQHNNVSVLFTDFKGFTQLSEN